MIATQKIISIKIAKNSYEEVVNYIIRNSKVRKKGFIAVANVHMTIEAYDDLKFQEILAEADFATADGMPLVYFNRFLNNIPQERAAGMDLVPDLLKLSSENNLSVLFYGGASSMLNILKEKISNSFSTLDAHYYSPPFRTLSSEEESEIEQMINKINPHLIFVALGCPKQEKWMYNNYKKFNAIMLGVGGAVPVYAGIVERAPEWMQKLSLEWLFRLIKEPKRLFKRYFYTNLKFLWLTLRYLITKKI